MTSYGRGEVGIVGDFAARGERGDTARNLRTRPQRAADRMRRTKVERNTADLEKQAFPKTSVGTYTPRRYFAKASQTGSAMIDRKTATKRHAKSRRLRLLGYKRICSFQAFFRARLNLRDGLILK